MAEAQERCSSAEFTEWMAYFELEPWGPFANWQRSAIAAALLNAQRSKGKAVKADRFLPRKETVQTPEQQSQAMRARAIAAGALKVE